MIGKYYAEDLLQEWFIRNLPSARAVLADFKLLEQLMDGFKGYEGKTYLKMHNIIMRLCLFGSNHENIKRLQRIESVIDEYYIKLGANQRNDFRSKLTSDSNLDSISVVAELEVAFYLMSRLGKQNVDLYPKLINGKLSDVRARVNGKVIYVEVGSLSTSEKEKKIQKIFDSSAEHLGKKINSASFIRLEVNTSNLVLNDKGQIDVKKSINKMNTEIDKLFIDKLAGYEGSFILSELSYELMFDYDELIQRLSDPIVRQWLEFINPQVFTEISLIQGIIIEKAKGAPLVEIHSENFFPSNVASMELTAFLNHMIRQVKGQITRQQMQPNEPNIIVAQGSSWVLSVIESREINVLYKLLQSLFEEANAPHLSGVVFFENDIAKGVYINNSYAAAASILQKQDIAILGLKWFSPQTIDCVCDTFCFD